MALKWAIYGLNLRSCAFKLQFDLQEFLQIKQSYRYSKLEYFQARKNLSPSTTKNFRSLLFREKKQKIPPNIPLHNSNLVVNVQPILDFGFLDKFQSDFLAGFSVNCATHICKITTAEQIVHVCVYTTYNTCMCIYYV